ncbi:ferredoxin family protein [Aquamicrobium lusatiense]|nr:ferredoxin family protein [Aquamicrobium lusatiense]MDH4989336.1 ferredoxin family protein [Aquamicrobium lusatiense]
MIELVSEARCVTCDLCVKVCPMDVFERMETGLPVVARQIDCQTCFMCEAHCPTDALYVAPERWPLEAGTLDETDLAKRNLLGSYRARLGWGKGRRPPLSFEAAVELSIAESSAPGTAAANQPRPATLAMETRGG